MLIEILNRQPYNHQELVRCVEEKGADIEEGDIYSKKTPLMLACEYGLDEAVVYLLAHGADVHAQNDSQYTAMHFAARAPINNEIIFRALTDKGANIDAKSFRGKTSLMLACEEGNAQSVQCLLSLGADKKIRNNYGFTALQYAVDSSINSKKIAALEAMLDNGADIIEETDAEGNTSLITACISQHRPTVNCLLKHHAKINTQNNAGKAAIHFMASQAGQAQILADLLDKKANIELMDNEGNTALILACQANDTGSAKLLLERGANAKAINRYGVSALHWAARHGNLEILGALLDSPIENRPNINLKASGNESATIQSGTALHWAASAGQKEAVTKLIDHNASLEERDTSGDTALHLAIPVSEEIAVALVKEGADVSARNQLHETPLHLAAQKNSVSFINKLLRHGADLRAKDNSGRTVMHWAVENEDPDVIKRLAALGLGVNEPDDSGKLALHYAAELDCTTAIPTLVMLGANILATCHDGKTALDLADRAGASYETIIALLLLGARIDGHELAALADPFGAANSIYEMDDTFWIAPPPLDDVAYNSLLQRLQYLFTFRGIPLNFLENLQGLEISNELKKQVEGIFKSACYIRAIMYLDERAAKNLPKLSSEEPEQAKEKQFIVDTLRTYINHNLLGRIGLHKLQDFVAKFPILKDIVDQAILSEFSLAAGRENQALNSLIQSVSSSIEGFLGPCLFLLEEVGVPTAYSQLDSNFLMSRNSPETKMKVIEAKAYYKGLLKGAHQNFIVVLGSILAQGDFHIEVDSDNFDQVSMMKTALEEIDPRLLPPSIQADLTRLRVKLNQLIDLREAEVDKVNSLKPSQQDPSQGAGSMPVLSAILSQPASQSATGAAP
jgi:ankyrin repeat protein